MMLVEVIMGKKTGDAALAIALDYVRAIRKTPIVVNDSRGFYTSRVVGTYIREGHLMLTEGVPAAMIENVGAHGRHAGRPALAQRRGRGRSRLENPEGDRSRSRRRQRSIRGRRRCSRRWSKSAAASAARTARAFTIIRRTARSGCGPGSPNCSRRSSIPTRSTSTSSSSACSAIQALETARCFEEGVLTDVREADVGSILGFGFAPFTGGTHLLHRRHGRRSLRRALQPAREEIRRRVSSRRSCCATWRRRGETFYHALRAGKAAKAA